LATPHRTGSAASSAAHCAGHALLRAYLPLALLAAALPVWAGNVWPWAVAQYGGVLWLLVLAALPARPGGLPLRLGWVLLGYAAAKVLEGLDAAVLLAHSHVVSGHTLKHLAAAAACWPVLAVLQVRQPPAGEV